MKMGCGRETTGSRKKQGKKADIVDTTGQVCQSGPAGGGRWQKSRKENNLAPGPGSQQPFE